MVHLITPHYQRKRFFRPRRRLNVWGIVRSFQLLELAALTGAIALVWLGARLDNQSSSWAEIPSSQMESAQVQTIDRVRGG
jgi:hypothetical protein